MPLGGRKGQQGRGGHQKSAGLTRPRQGSRSGLLSASLILSPSARLLVRAIPMLTVATGLWVLNFALKVVVHPLCHVPL